MKTYPPNEVGYDRVQPADGGLLEIGSKEVVLHFIWLIHASCVHLILFVQE